MEEKEEYKSFREFCHQKIPGIKGFMDEIKDQFSTHIITLLQSHAENELKVIKHILNFKLRLVIDNNILFASIRGLIKGNKDVKDSFFYKLALHPSTEFYAPPYLEKEIFRKIDELFNDNEKEKANSFAQILLNTIEIKEAFYVEDWLKAKRGIGHRDLDDIPYLALCFDLDSHGVMSNDKIFAEEQKDMKSWSIGDTGKMTANINEGMISFFILGHTTTIVQGIYTVTSAFFAAVYHALSEFVMIVLNVLRGGFSVLAKVPPIILILLGFSSLIAYVANDEVQDSVNQMFIDLKNKLKEMVLLLRDWFIKMRDTFIKLYHITKPFLKDASIMFGYFAISSQSMMEQINQIEAE